jgi:TatD DNase family protein
MIDTHCHLTGDRYEGGVGPILTSARAAGLSAMIAVAVDVEDAKAAQSLSEAEPDVWCTAGVHPSEAGRDHDVEQLRQLMKHPRCVAWGEMGLDGHWPDPPLPAQRVLFEAQLSVIKQVEGLGGALKPIILHSRRAVEEVLETLKRTGICGSRCVFHCFTEGPDLIQEVLAFGAHVSFTGVVTYRNAADVAVASDAVPLDRLMVETDSPYLTPEPHRGTWPNEPANVVHVSHFLAARRGMSNADFEAATDATSRGIFGLP